MSRTDPGDGKQAGAVAPEFAFPLFPQPEILRVRDLIAQLQRSQRMDAAALRRAQAAQLRALLRHARRGSPMWRERLEGVDLDERAGAGVEALLPALPVLSRHALQSDAARMRVAFPGREALQVGLARSSGSTGVPVEVEKLAMVQTPLHRACQFLLYLSARMDPTRRLGLLRGRAEDADSISLGAEFPWVLGRDPPAFSRTTKGRTAADLYAALVRLQPHYLTCGPATARRLAEHAIATGRRDVRVEACFTLGSTVTAEIRELVREGLGARIWDNYSTEETGFIALQCPLHDHYHVVAPTVALEIVDAAGKPCPPGQPGSVLVTVLHSYAMPLVRYEVGDIGEWGTACDCGIGWPVLRRVLGRTRHMITHPDGTRGHPRIYARDFARVPGLREYRLTLHSDRVVVVQVVTASGLSSDRQATLVELVREAMGYPYPVVVREVRAIDWSSANKQDDFGISSEPSTA